MTKLYSLYVCENRSHRFNRHHYTLFIYIENEVNQCKKSEFLAKKLYIRSMNN